MGIIEKIDKYLSESDFVGIPNEGVSGEEVNRLSDQLHLTGKNGKDETALKDKKGFQIEMQHFLYIINAINYYHFDDKVKKPNSSRSGNKEEGDGDLIWGYLDTIKKTVKDMRKISKRVKGQGLEKIEPYAKNLKRLYNLIENIENNVDINVKRIDISDYGRRKGIDK